MRHTRPFLSSFLARCVFVSKLLSKKNKNSFAWFCAYTHRRARLLFRRKTIILELMLACLNKNPFLFWTWNFPLYTCFIIAAIFDFFRLFFCLFLLVQRQVVLINYTKGKISRATRFPGRSFFFKAFCIFFYFFLFFFQFWQNNFTISSSLSEHQNRRLSFTTNKKK